MMKASTRLDSSQTAVLHKQRRRRGSPEMNKRKVSASLCHEGGSCSKRADATADLSGAIEAGNKEDSEKYSKRTVMTQSFSFSSFILLLSSQTAGLGSLSLVISSLNWCSSLLTSHADTGGSLCGKLPLLPRFQRS
ncbi:unnamed protein product [Brassica oleracea var. botrytis]|uniref:Uncharacterized protein n=2 Tax=Brassica TaxID=3705 RepID=A0A0D3DSI4_BRAOL|nr:hypothetical protein Bca52824_077051 [Brassica carinata]